MSANTDGSLVDKGHFRKVLGSYPTGVCVITARNELGRHAMVVGSFTSISLNPPLIGFFPDESSSSWPKIEKAGRFCVNVLGASQLSHCQRFASKAEDKFAELLHGESPAGQPILEGVVAWLDCKITSTQKIGDHLLVVGAVEALEKGLDQSPLMFHGGAYHSLQALV
jgi:3-hydroxy-9,10-secoandrosta-1,3,5(10)-triene-9,17-dione monooxygenase reductase component